MGGGQRRKTSSMELICEGSWLDSGCWKNEEGATKLWVLLHELVEAEDGRATTNQRCWCSGACVEKKKGRVVAVLG
jgi:hypothetical protein